MISMKKQLKQWLKSKTAYAAAVLGAIPFALENYTPEIKQIITDHISHEWSVFYGVIVFTVMIVMRKFTTTSIEDK